MNTSKRPRLPRTAKTSAGLRWVHGSFGPWWIVANAIVVFVVSISVHSILAQAASRRERHNPIHLTKDGEKWVAKTMRSLTLEEKIGQMLMGRCFLDYASFESPDYKELKDNLQKYHIGSLVVAAHINQQGLVRPSPLDAAKVANQLQADSKLPLLVAADLERGLASRLKNVPDFPWPMALGAAGDPAGPEQIARSSAVRAAVLPTMTTRAGIVRQVVHCTFSYGLCPEGQRLSPGGLTAVISLASEKKGLRLINAVLSPGTPAAFYSLEFNYGLSFQHLFV